MRRADSPDIPLVPDLAYERAAARRGMHCIAGVDEAGRGPLAGPVVVAAVVLDRRRIPDGLNDSKKLSAEVREALCEKIMASAVFSIAVAPPAMIEQINILQATLWAMRQAVLHLATAVDYVLIDGNILPKNLPRPAEAVIGGDGRSMSIAAASIVAKVTRDRMCQIMHCDEPRFGFHGHKGYSTPEHLSALHSHGPSRHHRMDFAPCSEAFLLHGGKLTAS